MSLNFSAEMQEIIKLARTKAVEYGQDVIGSEFILDAIVQHETNSGVFLLESRHVKKSFIKGQLQERLNTIRKAPLINTALPKMSASAKKVFDLAAVFSTSGVTAAAIVTAMYKNTDSVAGRILFDAGYTEIGEQERRQDGASFRSTGTPILNQYSTDLTALARRGLIDPVIGRNDVLDRMIEILGRRKKNNPVLIGDAGVGKTAIAEGLAVRIANDEVPSMLQNKRLVSLDVNSIVAGTQFRGQFEKRMEGIIHELERAVDVLVFIDELQVMMGAGGTEGTGDTASIIKPALSKGNIRCIGATTLADYHKHIETDGALERRFQKIIVEPTSIEETRIILQNIKTIYEVYHGVEYSADTIECIIRLADRYITDRAFPDKAVDLLDESGSITSIKGNKIVSSESVQEIVAKSTGIPVKNLGIEERTRLLTIEQDLGKKVIGQQEAIKVVAASIKRARTGVKSGKRPSSFLFIGSTGVGKTELAKQLSIYLFDTENALIRFDMGEFAEKFTVSSLIGSPPGYIGFDEGGKLTEAVRRHPYSVVLFDEIEKAHPDVYDVFLQILDDGFLVDASGRKVDFKNTLVIMTSNLGVNGAQKKSLGFSDADQQLETKNNFQKAIKEYFKPEFINRIDEIVVFNSLSSSDIKNILELYLQDMNTRFNLVLTDAAKDYFSEHGYSLEFGARPLRRLLDKEIELQVADLMLSNPQATKFIADVEQDAIKVKAE